MEHDRIAVVDFGGQYAHLIATKLRRLRVLAEIRLPEDPTSAFDGVRGIVLSGSPALSSQNEQSGWNREILELDLPILGLCFGHQEIAKRYGGRIEHTQREYGPARLRIPAPSAIFHGLPAEQTVWMSHGDTVTQIGPDFVETAVSVDLDGSVHRNAAIASDRLRRYGFQFHPEVDDTEHGERMLENFALRICGCRPTWTMGTYLQGQIERVREAAKDRGVFLLASGGVDSTVCAKLIGLALGPARLHLLHIDNGLMRKNESACVLAELRRLGLGDNLHFVDATDTFLGALRDTIDPEQKRRMIGETFVEVFETEATRLGLSKMLLGQGTIYPDTIETGGTKHADVIKTHHNRVPLIRQWIEEGRVVEPIRDLYKTEVRELAEQLGVAPELVWRHPFPGPGLGVRVLGSDGHPPAGHDPDRATPVIRAVCEPVGLRGALLPARSVGVKADLRSYEQPVVVWGTAPFDSLVTLAGQVCARVPHVNRCVWDLTGRGIESALPVRATVTRERLDLLREADSIVMAALDRHGLMRRVWQCPTVLLPMCVNGHGRELVVVRPVMSARAMTARPAELPADLARELCEAILPLPGVSGVVLDLTTKPPGTIEWE